jgi:putative SOS response-associated peptidase YedK
MCNLYKMTAAVEAMRRLFGSFEGDRTNLPPFNEIYPGRQAPVLRKENGSLTLDVMTWGFPGPAAAKGRPVTNVRNLTSPFWRSALEHPERRCIVPVTAFCEWTAEPDPATGRKRKVWFGMRESEPELFAFAGIWRPGDGEKFMAFLTCEPNETVKAVHPKAMPVMLDVSDIPRWLESPRVDACELAKPFDDARMRVVA